MCLIKDYKGDPVEHVHCRICRVAASTSPCLKCVWGGRDEKEEATEDEDF